MPRTEAFKKSIAYSLSASWNELQPELKFQENAITFKWALNVFHNLCLQFNAAINMHLFLFIYYIRDILSSMCL
jgi:hypothetical protein